MARKEAREEAMDAMEAAGIQLEDWGPIEHILNALVVRLAVEMAYYIPPNVKHRRVKCEYLKLVYSRA